MTAYLLIIIFLLAIISFLLFKYKSKKGGLLEYNEERHETKEKAKSKIINMLKEKGRATNQEVEELLEVSDATATRYLEELERAGKIAQKGNKRGAYYEINPLP